MEITQKDYELIKKYIDDKDADIPIETRIAFYKYDKIFKRYYYLYKNPNKINLPVYYNGEKGLIIEINKDQVGILLDNGKTIILEADNFNSLFEIINPEFHSLILTFPHSKSDNFNEAILFLKTHPSFENSREIIGNKTFYKIPISTGNLSDFDQLLNLVYRFKGTALKSNAITLSGYHSQGVFSCFNELIDNYKDDYCFGNHRANYPNDKPYKNPFGCICLLDDNPFDGWYTKGIFTSESTYDIKKDEIKKLILDFKSVCPLYDKNRALKILNEMPSIIEINEGSEWTTLEFIDSKYNKETRLVPKYIKQSIFNNNNYFAPAQQYTLNFINNAINTEKRLANHGFREPRKAFLNVITNNDCCDNCKRQHGIYYEATELLNLWKEARKLPVPVPDCKNESCRCLLFKFHPDSQFIDLNGQVKLKTENEKDWGKWFLLNEFKQNVPESYLPELDWEDQRKIFDLKITLTIQDKTYSSEIFNKATLLKLGQLHIQESIESVLKPFFKDSKSFIEYYDNLFAKYSDSEMKRGKLNWELKFYVLLLQRYKYCQNKNLSSSGLFGFYIDDKGDDNINFVLLNNFAELNAYERLSLFDPELGDFEKDIPEYCEGFK
jgi:hypothetical protein